VRQTQWEWPMTDCQENHSERAALLRPIQYEMTVSAEGPVAQSQSGRALSLNISRGGMLVLMDRPPAIDQVMKLYVPTPITGAETPTLAEVRWSRELPFGQNSGAGPYFVGLKFMF
jgi:PilZ domain